jgi:hypothetical protein
MLPGIPLRDVGVDGFQQSALAMAFAIILGLVIPTVVLGLFSPKVERDRPKDKIYRDYPIDGAAMYFE